MHQIIELDGVEYTTSADAARYLNLSRAQISKLCKSGKLSPLKIGGNVFVPFAEVRRYKALEGSSARKPGRTSNERE